MLQLQQERDKASSERDQAREEIEVVRERYRTIVLGEKE
jgi:hypothetical protein